MEQLTILFVVMEYTSKSDPVEKEVHSSYESAKNALPVDSPKRIYTIRIREAK